MNKQPAHAVERGERISYSSIRAPRPRPQRVRASVLKQLEVKPRETNRLNVSASFVRLDHFARLSAQLPAVGCIN
jgi:hypothetical protein